MKITEIMPLSTTGFVTARDHFVIDFDESPLMARIEEFRSNELSNDQIRGKYFAGKGSAKYPDGDSRGWQLPNARVMVRADEAWDRRIRTCLYRPFDVRCVYYVRWMVDWPRPEVMRHMLTGSNVALASARSNKSPDPNHFFCSRFPMEAKCAESTTQSCLFPLYLYREEGQHGALGTSEGRRPNLNPVFISDIEKRLGLRFVRDGIGNLEDTCGPEDVLHYIYAIFHSSSYRARYAQFLKTDFPRIPLTSDADLFRTLCAKGSDLVDLHLLESSVLDQAVATHTNRGGGNNVVEKSYPKYDRGRVLINRSSWFERVPEDVWSFHIGGYQVCEKWLKDRRGRVLSAEDVAHYQRIVVALNETIRLMDEIDEVIEAHGGWPDAFWSVAPGSTP